MIRITFFLYFTQISAELMKLLEGYAMRFKVPKNRIIKDALRAYFERLKKAEYVRSLKKAASDDEVVLMAEEGLQ